MLIAILGILVITRGNILNVSILNFTHFDGANTYAFFENVLHDKFEGKWTGDVLHSLGATLF